MAEEPSEAKVEAYMFAAAWLCLGDAREEVAEALRLIEGVVEPHGTALRFQLLAVRRYLRIGGKRLHANWSWSNAEVARHKTMEPTRTLYAEAAKVQANFRRANPGYELGISPVRSLQRQARLWGQNSTVNAASGRLMRDINRELQKPWYPDACGGPAVVRFASVLRDAHVHPEPSSAAPGSSDHGRGTAVDFVVMRGKTLLAGTSTGEVKKLWDADGWSQKLKAAVLGTRLRGPLMTKNLYEPWHWTL